MYQKWANDKNRQIKKGIKMANKQMTDTQSHYIKSDKKKYAQFLNLSEYKDFLK